MHLAKLSIRDFRGIRHADLALNQHNVFIGANNSGKTTIVEALALLFGRDRMVRSLTEHDFFGGNPGAALVDGGATLRLRNCTVTLNRAAQSTATIGAIQDVHGGFGRTFITNTILAGNGPGFQSNDCSNLRSEGGGNIIGSVAGCNASLLPSDRTNVAAGLAPLAANGGATRTHLPGAIAIDAAVDAECLGDDQRGTPRPRDGDGDGFAHCDIGAVEAGELAVFADGFE